MPYINYELRQLASTQPISAGELNYKITRALIDYVVIHKLSYATINDVIGALEGAKAEFQRRVVAPYEDRKIFENGDVYPNVFE